MRGQREVPGWRVAAIAMAWLLVALGVPGIRCVSARENTSVDAAAGVRVFS